MKSFRTLDLAISFYQEMQAIPLPRHLREQMDRAAASVSLNLSEGNAKFSYKDKSRFYQIAYGSFRECQTILRLHNLPPAEIDSLSKHLGSSLYRLVEATKARAAADKAPGF